MEVKEPSAKYLPRSGYKRTEVGVIPEDWDVVPMGSLGSFSKGQGIRKNEAASGEIPCVRYGEIYTHHNDHIRAFNSFISSDVAKSSKQLKKGDLLFAGSGETKEEIGKCVAFLKDVEAYVGSDIVVLTPTKGDAAFFGYLFNAPIIARQKASKGQGDAVVHISANALASVKIPLPSTNAEQVVIAEALYDADAQIESLEKLIAKKRYVKQGAMQELLAPKDTDRVSQLQDISLLKGRIGWQGLKQSEFTANEDEPFLITGMNFKDGAIRWNEVYHVSEARYEVAKAIQLQIDDVLMTKDGTIGKMLYIDSIPYPGKASLNSHLLLFRPLRESYCPKYLYYQLTSKRFKDFVELSKSGTTFFGLSQGAVGKYPVLLPSMADQRRIASILSDIDAELEALEIRLTKARRIKQSMMQELLTGRIRLV